MPAHAEDRLREKLRKIEALYAGAATAGEKFAAGAAAEDSEEVPVVASLSKATCSDAYFFAAAENIQVHGGIGFTWEHDIHLYYKRLLSLAYTLGSADDALEELAALVLAQS